MKSVLRKAQMVTAVFFNRHKFPRNMTSLIGIALAVLMLSGAPAAAFDSTFPDNTVFVVYEYESGFHGPDPYGGWGANDELFIVKETYTFMADGTFSTNAEFDDGLTRYIGDDPGTGNNTFTTTYDQDPTSESGTYSISPDGTMTIAFAGEEEDEGEGTALLSENGQTIIFGYSEFDNPGMYTSCGIGMGVKKGSGFNSTFPDNTIYQFYQYESGFHGSDPYGGWGANDQLFVLIETFTFMADGTFSTNLAVDDGIMRHIGDDPSTGNNMFTTTYSHESGSESGTYTISPDGAVTITFTGEDGGEGIAVLSADEQTMLFGYSEFDDTAGDEFASFGIGVGVKRGSGFSSTFPDNTTYQINEYERGFHGPDPYGGWGANDQLYVVKEIFTFMADGTFRTKTELDDEIMRHIGDDLSTGNNTFTTTFNHETGSESGTYSISPAGAVTITFTGEDGGEGTAVLSADGQTFIFGYGEFDDSEQYATFGFGLGVKRLPVQRFMSAGAMFLLLVQ